jgi:cell wall-associated NlpC family hydrolase
MKNIGFYRSLPFCCTLALASACSGPRLAESLPAEQEEVALPQLANVPEHGMQLAEFAKTLTGVKYRYGGNSPETGLDCSGFIIYVFRETLGIHLPRRVADISRIGQEISRPDLQPGDLVFFNTQGDQYSHAGIYLGDNKFIHSPRSGKTVRIADMGLQYWTRHFNGARRLVGAGGNGFQGRLHQGL